MIRLQGIGGLPGIVRGKAHVLQSRSDAAGENRQQPLNPEEEKQRFEEALKGVRAPMRSGLEASTDETLRELYAAHLEMTEDPALVEGVLEKIDERHCSAEDALDAFRRLTIRLFVPDSTMSVTLSSRYTITCILCTTRFRFRIFRRGPSWLPMKSFPRKPCGSISPRWWGLCAPAVT